MMFARFILSEMDIKELKYTIYNIQQFNKISFHHEVGAS